MLFEGSTRPRDNPGLEKTRRRGRAPAISPHRVRHPTRTSRCSPCCPWRPARRRVQTNQSAQVSPRNTAADPTRTVERETFLCGACLWISTDQYAAASGDTIDVKFFRMSPRSRAAAAYEEVTSSAYGDFRHLMIKFAHSPDSRRRTLVRSDYPENPRRGTTALTRPEATHLLHHYPMCFVGTKQRGRYRPETTPCSGCSRHHWRAC